MKLSPLSLTVNTVHYSIIHYMVLEAYVTFLMIRGLLNYFQKFISQASETLAYCP